MDPGRWALDCAHALHSRRRTAPKLATEVSVVELTGTVEPATHATRGPHCTSCVPQTAAAPHPFGMARPAPCWLGQPKGTRVHQSIAQMAPP